MDKVHGYVAWTGFNPISNKASIFWSDELAGQPNKAKIYFDCYMKLESSGREDGDERGTEKGVNINEEKA